MSVALTPRDWNDNLPLRLAALTTLACAALALGSVGLIVAPVALLTMISILIVGLAVPRWIPSLVNQSPRRTTLALGAVGLLVVATAGSGRGALFSGEMSGPLPAAVTELGLPTGLPIGLLAALAAGALVAVSLELADRRGVQSALVLSTAVLGLASVAGPGPHLLPALIPGWPAAMFALARLCSDVSANQNLSPAGGTKWSGPEARPQPSTAGTGLVIRTTLTGGAARATTRWQVLPVFAVITLSLLGLSVAVVSGVATIGDRAGQFGTAAGFDAATGGRSASDYLGGEMDLAARGTLGSDPVLDVPAGSPRLWRAGTLDEYDGRGWLATGSPGGLPRFQRQSGGAAQLLDPMTTTSPGPIRTDHVRLMRTGATQVLAPGRLLGVTSTALRAGAELFVAPGDRVTIAAGGAGSDRYEVRSQVLPLADDLSSDAVAGAAAVTGDESLDPRWSGLPETVPERVRSLGRKLVSGAPSRLAAVRAIEAELAGRMTYVLDSPVPPSGADAVDDVLFVSHSGFCEQFASAEVVLLRAGGVPARLAVGFAGGEPQDDGFRRLLRSDAHAWVEVWFPGVGWVTSDPTPAADETATWWQSVQDDVRRLVADRATWTVVALVLILGSAGGLVLFRQRSRPATGPEMTARRVDPDLAAAFTRLESALRTEGRPRAPNETVAALARRLTPESEGEPGGAPAPDPVSDRGLADALLTLQRALYARQPPSRLECLSAATAIDERRTAASREVRSR
jgi:hypothetical protein